MSSEEKNQGAQFQIELTPEIAQGVYANAINRTFKFRSYSYFVRILPGLPKANVQSRIILAPEHAKRLMYALQDNISKYEQNFGPIHMPEDGPRTIAPFQVNKGEA